MAKIIWSDRALQDFAAIFAYVAQFNPLAAQRLAVKLLTTAQSLDELPNRGRPVVRGLRELTIVFPYIIRYEVKGADVLIVRIRHGARRPTE